MGPILSADRWIQQIVAALGFDPNECRRIVIDATAGKVVTIYVEKYGSEALLDLAPPDVAGLNISVVGG